MFDTRPYLKPTGYSKQPWTLFLPHNGWPMSTEELRELVKHINEMIGEKK